jgi:hypothetical protein
VPFDIPIEAFAVELAGGAHPSVRSLGSRRLVYVEHRQTVRRAYRRRQLALAMGMAGAFVAVAAVALAPGGADASAPVDTRAEGPIVKAALPAVALAVASPAAPAAPVGTGRPVSPMSPVRPTGPPPGRLRPNRAEPSPPPGGRSLVAGSRPSADRDETRIPPPYVPGYHGRPLADDPFLVCTRMNESIYAGGYRAVSRGGQYRGAYQFDRDTWDGTARYLDRFDLVGVDPAAAPPVVQDLLAYSLYKWQGASHWANRCAGLP